MPVKQEQINEDLDTKDQSESLFQKTLLQQYNAYMLASCARMSDYWQSWDRHDQIYRGYRIFDRDDKTAVKRKEPAKMIVPVSFAQIQTALSFLFSAFTQRDHFFELTGTGQQNAGALIMEADLSFQLRKKQFLIHLYCWLLDTLKYGFGVSKYSWEVEHSRFRTAVSVQPGKIKQVLGILTGNKPQAEIIEEISRIISYEGHTFTNVSPWSFYPDPNLPLARFQEGLFVAHEEDVAMQSLIKMKGVKYHGLKMVKNFNENMFKTRKRRVGDRFKNTNYKDILFNGNKAEKSVVLTEMQMSIVPSEWTEKYDIDFGSEKYPIKFILAVANDNKVIRFEPAGHLHDQYTYNIIEYTPDHNNFYNPGLSETIFQLQDTITWFLNAHIAGVRTALHNRFIVDPTKIHVEDIEAGRAAIRTKGSAIRDLKSAISQLQITDVTQNHIRDIDSLEKLVEITTGINENALGQTAKGRRSAQEIRGVQGSTSARLRMHGQLFWAQGIQPLGAQMLSNTRQGRSQEMYNFIHGSKAAEVPYEQVILAQPDQIAGGYDFVAFDGTLPSDKDRRATLLSDLTQTMLQNPETIQLLKMNPLVLLNRIFELQGIKNLREFELNPQQANAPIQPEVVSDEQALEAAAGGAQPVDLSGANFLQQLIQ